MKRITAGLSSLILIVLFSQCLPPEERWAALVPPSRGSWYYRGDSLSLLLNNPREHEPSDRIICYLEKGNLTLQGGNFSYDENISLPIPEETESGILTFSAFETGSGGGQSKTDIYYLERKYGHIGISSYPPLPMAGSIVEVHCTVENPGKNPYIRWTLEGKALGEGYFSDGWDRYCFFSPPKKGNYTVKAELFPGKPLAESDLSPWTGEGEIFLNEIADEEGLLSAGEWDNLFYCDGTHIDRGINGMNADAGWVLNSLDEKNLSPVILDGDRGYGFSPDSTLRYDGKLLEGINGPLSRITSRILIKRPAGTGSDETAQIFNTRDGTGDFGFTLFLRDNQLQLSWQLGSDRFLRSYLEMDDSLYNRPLRLTVEVNQTEKALLIRWYLDDILRREDPFEGQYLPPYYEGGGRTVWGKGDTGYPSFEGVLFEWGFKSDASPETVRNDQG
ncbi:MAG: hypothetical protein JXA95_18295 [Spirochaetales bacterium]|nr:hypothetical protein [Spirochaetales bacterium]